VSHASGSLVAEFRGMATQAARGGGYTAGFELRPLTGDGDLDLSSFPQSGPHPPEEDDLYKMAEENREGGNKLVQAGQYEEAIARYSELIMQTRSLEQETGVEWTEDGYQKVRALRASAYLNLSLCFLKTEQWTHASNTATRAMQGDKDPPDPKEAVLTADKKAKALFRRATAQCEGFGNFDKAIEDLRAAHELEPENKAVEQMLRKMDIAVKKTERAANKKMAGFLNTESVKSGEGIFDDEDRDRDTSGVKPPTEPVKMKEGLWVVPKEQEEEARKKAGGEDADTKEFDYNEISREIAEMKEEDPETFAELREKIKGYVMEQAAAPDAADGPVAAA